MVKREAESVPEGEGQGLEEGAAGVALGLLLGEGALARCCFLVDEEGGRDGN